MNAIEAVNHYAQRGERVDGVLQHIVISEIERLQKALSYYADEKHYEPYGAFNTGSCDITEDEGYIARQALAGESNE